MMLFLKNWQDKLSAHEQESKKVETEFKKLKEELEKLTKNLNDAKVEKETNDKVYNLNQLKFREKIYTEALKNGELVIKQSLRLFEDPVLYNCKSSADFLLSQLQPFQENLTDLIASYNRYQVHKDTPLIDEVEKENFLKFLNCLSGFSNSVGETVVSGKITSIAAADVEKGEQLAELSRTAGQISLELIVKMKTTTKKLENDETLIKLDDIMKKIIKMLNELLPKVHDISKEEIGDLIEKEMQNTSQAIEAAVAKLQV